MIKKEKNNERLLIINIPEENNFQRIKRMAMLGYKKKQKKKNNKKEKRHANNDQRI